MNCIASRSPSYLLELCIASLDDARVAVEGGARRLELNTALELGGLTPSIGLLERVKASVAAPVIAMVRPRPGGFCYSDADWRVMLRDAERMVACGADGIAFGVLSETGRIDLSRCREMLSVISERQAVFHRAFDVTPDPIEAIEALIDLGMTRVLTSGQAATAIEGAAMIRQLIERAKGRIEILPGAGIRPDNVRSLIHQTGCTQMHASLHHMCHDTSVAGRPGIAFGVADEGGSYAATDGAAVREMVRVLRQMT